jgi:hypothetical protein
MTSPSPGSLKRIVVRSAKNPWEIVSPTETMHANLFGNNVGNLMFSHAVHRVLSIDDLQVDSNRFGGRKAAAKFNDEYDAFVIPLANAFRPSFHAALDRLTSAVEKLTIPVIVVGVGAQFNLRNNQDRLEPIEESVKRFCAAVLDRSATIGVRGEVTYDYLKGLGFSAVDVIGCPSMFMYGPELPPFRPIEQLTPESKVSVGISPYVKPMGPIVMSNLERYPKLTYLPQDIQTLRKMILGENEEELGLTSDIPVYLNHPLFQRDQVRFFVDPLPWIDYLAKRDFWFGTRIHGSIASVLSGAPTVLLAHDSRTLELAQYHEIPYRFARRLKTDVDLQRLHERANYEPMRANHAGRFDTYAAFLKRNGLEHRFLPGKSGAEFDRKCAEAAYPDPVRTSVQEKERSRMAKLRERVTGRRARPDLED